MGIALLSPLQTCVQGSVLVVLLLLMRKLFLKALPKRVMCAMWLVALARFIVPWGLSIPVEVGSVLGWDSGSIAVTQISQNDVSPIGADADDAVIGDMQVGGAPAAFAVSGSGPGGLIADMSADDSRDEVATSEGAGTSAFGCGLHVLVDLTNGLAAQATYLVIAWAAGSVATGLFFAAAYFRGVRRFKDAREVANECAREWLATRGIGRRVHLFQSGRIDGPMTYGIFRPVIVMPVDFDWDAWPAARLALEHEYAHILRLDALKKLSGLIIACLYWFDPLVWVALAFFNRDLELACDEVVVKQCSPNRKKAYAHLILDIAQSHIVECRNFDTMLAAGSLEERIVSIMATDKKASGIKRVCAGAGALLLLAVMVVSPQYMVAQGSESAPASEPTSESELLSDGNDGAEEGSLNVIGAEVDSDAGDKGSQTGKSSRLVAKQYHDMYADIDLTDFWTPRYTVTIRSDALAQGYEWDMDEGTLCERVKDYATDVLSFHVKGSDKVLAGVFCASADKRSVVEQSFVNYSIKVISANGMDDSLRVYVLELADAPKFELRDGSMGFLYNANSSGLNSQVYGLEGFTEGDPDAYGAVGTMTDSGLTVSSPAWGITVPSELVDDSIFNEVGEQLYYSQAGQGACCTRALRLPLSDDTMVEVYCAASDDVVWSDYLGDKVKVGPVGTRADGSVVMVGVYTLEDMRSDDPEPVDSERLGALWQRAASWVSLPE